MLLRGEDEKEGSNFDSCSKQATTRRRLFFLNTAGEIDLPKLTAGRESHRACSTRKVTTAKLNYNN